MTISRSAQISVSNIAWEAAEDSAVAALLARRGIGAIEVTPARLFADPGNIAAAEVKSVRAFWADRGIRLAAMQSLLFGQCGGALFEDATARETMARQLRRVIAVAGELGCGPLVFGGPRSRRRGELPMEDAYLRAAVFFRPLAELAQEHGCVLCFEPNAADYGCDFVQKIAEAAHLARLIGHPAFRVQLDVGCFMMERDDIGDVHAAAPLIGHFHASAPNLAPVGEGETPLTPLLAAARAGGYRGLISIEMRKLATGPSVAAIERALDYVIERVTPIDA